MPVETDYDDLPDDDQKETEKALVSADLAAIKLTVGGQKIEHDVWSVELEQSVDTHHVAKIMIRERGAASKETPFVDVSKYLDFLGKTFSLKIDAELSNEPSPVSMSFNGVIGHVELKNSVDGINVIIIRGFSPTIIMDGARKNASYFDMKATDIIESLVGNYKITKGKIESSSGDMEYCVQYRETDYDFIMRLAGDAGLFACYDGQEFRVTKANTDKSVSLGFPVTLGSFALDVGTKAYEYNMAVYNYTQKRNFIQDSKSITQQAALSDTGQKAAKASQELYKDSGFGGHTGHIEDAQSLDKVLSTKRSQTMGRMVVARGQSGNPTVVTGHSVSISNVGRMDGTYWVTKVKHMYAVNSGYYNTFECIPIDLAFPKARSARPNITNMQMAVVVDNNDPQQMGRIKVKFPWLESDETPWVRYMMSHAGQDRGWYWLPEIGDEVLVGYEHGSPDKPIVFGALYNSDDLPPGDAIDSKNNVKMFMTKSGNRLVFNDTDGSEEVQIITKDGKNIITMKTGGPTVIESEGAINIKADGDITMEGANISLDSKGEIKIKAATNATLEAGMNAEIKAGPELKIQGITVTVKGTPIQLN